MKVFKFGGASINSIERIQNVARIIQSFSGEKLLIIISAMGKTTNGLEKVAEAFFAGNKETALELFHQIKEEHIKLLAQLNPTAPNILADLFTEVEWLLHDKPLREYDYYYDQIVCCGELLSTAIVSNYLNSIAINKSLCNDDVCTVKKWYNILLYFLFRKVPVNTGFPEIVICSQNIPYIHPVIVDCNAV